MAHVIAENQEVQEREPEAIFGELVAKLTTAQRRDGCVELLRALVLRVEECTNARRDRWEDAWIAEIAAQLPKCSERILSVAGQQLPLVV